MTWPRRADAGMVFVLAAVARLGLVLASRGGPGGNFGYDAGVYYASADALIHGRLPYGDFVLLHPPAMMLALTPFAALGRVTTDHAGFIVANTAFALLGALSAVLVLRIARRLELPRSAALLGGIFYAVWFGAVGSEFSARLEPLGSFLFLVALYLLTGPRASSRRRRLLAGAALGAVVLVKIWWVVPAIIVLGWQLRPGAARRDAGWLAVGALASASVVAGPFFLAAPSAMWRMVVTDQLHRHGSTPTLTRLDEVSSVRAALPGLRGSAELAVLVLVGILLVGLAVAAWRVVACRLLVVIAAAQLVVLLAAPTYFPYYAGYPAASIALVVAAAAGSPSRVRSRRLGIAGAGVAVAASAVLTAAALLPRASPLVKPFPGDQLARPVTGLHCLMSDSPMALIELDALSRDLAHGCPNWVDVSGRTYDVDALHGQRYVGRRNNRKWQADVRRYLRSGDALILIRSSTGLSRASRKALTRGAVLARAHGVVIYRTGPRHGPRASPMP